jgi:hypothetical protein
MVTGPRPCGKTTLVRDLVAGNRESITIDDDTVLAAAPSNPTGLVRVLSIEPPSTKHSECPTSSGLSRLSSNEIGSDRPSSGPGRRRFKSSLPDHLFFKHLRQIAALQRSELSRLCCRAETPVFEHPGNLSNLVDSDTCKANGEGILGRFIDVTAPPNSAHGPRLGCLGLCLRTGSLPSYRKARSLGAFEGGSRGLHQAAGKPSFGLQSKAHFIAIASRLMRQILVDHPREVQSQMMEVMARTKLGTVLSCQTCTPIVCGLCRGSGGPLRRCRELRSR